MIRRLWRSIQRPLGLLMFGGGCVLLVVWHFHATLWVRDWPVLLGLCMSVIGLIIAVAGLEVANFEATLRPLRPFALGWLLLLGASSLFVATWFVPPAEVDEAEVEHTIRIIAAGMLKRFGDESLDDELFIQQAIAEAIERDRWERRDRLQLLSVPLFLVGGFLAIIGNGMRHRKAKAIVE